MIEEGPCSPSTKVVQVRTGSSNEGEILRQLDNLEDIVKHTDGVMNALISRLGVACTPPPPKCTDQEAGPIPESEIESRIVKIQVMVNSIRRELQDGLNRLRL